MRGSNKAILLGIATRYDKLATVYHAGLTIDFHPFKASGALFKIRSGDGRHEVRRRHDEESND